MPYLGVWEAYMPYLGCLRGSDRASERLMCPQMPYLGCLRGSDALSGRLRASQTPSDGCLRGSERPRCPI